jgi:hypothetical protein
LGQDTRTATPSGISPTHLLCRMNTGRLKRATSGACTRFVCLLQFHFVAHQNPGPSLASSLSRHAENTLNLGQPSHRFVSRATCGPKNLAQLPNSTSPPKT